MRTPSPHSTALPSLDLARQTLAVADRLPRWHHGPEIDSLRSRAIRLLNDALERQAVLLRDSYTVSSPNEVSPDVAATSEQAAPRTKRNATTEELLACALTKIPLLDGNGESIRYNVLLATGIHSHLAALQQEGAAK